MSNNIKNIIVFIEPNDEPDQPNLKASHSYLNRFTIDEDAAFELLGVYHLEKWSSDMIDQPDEFRIERKEKVKVTNSKDISCILEL